MSIKVMSLVFDHARKASGNDLIVLLCLADWGNDAGESWHSIKHLAARARLSERTAQRCITNLCNFGYLDVTKGGKYRGQTSRYFIQVDDLMDLAQANRNGYQPLPDEPDMGDNLTPLQASGMGDNLTPINPVRVTNQVSMGDKSGILQPLMGDTAVTQYVSNLNRNGTVKGRSASVPAIDPSTVKMVKCNAPTDYHVQTDKYEWAVRNGWRSTHQALQTEADKCFRYHRSEGRQKADWEAELDNWILRAISRNDDLGYNRGVDNGRPGQPAEGRAGNGKPGAGAPRNRAETFIKGIGSLAARQAQRLAEMDLDGEVPG